MRIPLVALLVAVVAVAACTDGDDKKKPDPRCDPDEARYEGYASDETCLVLLDAEDSGDILTTGINVPVLLSPTNGGAVAIAATSLTIAWDTPLDLDTTFARRPVKRSGWPLPSLIPVAHAHEPPVTGAIHMVRLTGLSGGDELLTFTSLLSTTLTGAALTRVTGSPGGEVTIELTSMYLEDNRIVNPANDGPFRAPAPAVVNIQ